jgi:hypothetical protein
MYEALDFKMAGAQWVTTLALSNDGNTVATDGNSNSANGADVSRSFSTIQI